MDARNPLEYPSSMRCIQAPIIISGIRYLGGVIKIRLNMELSTLAEVLRLRILPT